MAVARNLWGFIERRDHRVMRRMARWRAPRWIRYWMITATRMGDGWLWYGLGCMLLIFGGSQRFAAVEAAGVGAFAAGLVPQGALDVLRNLLPLLGHVAPPVNRQEGVPRRLYPLAAFRIGGPPLAQNRLCLCHPRSDPGYRRPLYAFPFDTRDAL